MDVGTRVREHREAAGMRQDQLAELCHVSRQTVSNWERNKTLPDIVSLKVMANELGTTVDALVGDDVPEIRRRADERARALAALFTANMLFSLFVEVSVTGSAWNLSPVFSTQGWAYLHCAVFGAWLIALVASWRLTRHLELVNVYDLLRYLNEHPSRGGAAPSSFLPRDARRTPLAREPLREPGQRAGDVDLLRADRRAAPAADAGARALVLGQRPHEHARDEAAPPAGLRVSKREFRAAHSRVKPGGRQAGRPHTRDVLLATRPS